MTKATATFNGTTIASTDNFEVVEGNVYFPPDSISKEYFKPTETHTHCPWKGDASYYTIEVPGKESKDAAWYYPKPFSKAEHIKDYVAFCKHARPPSPLARAPRLSEARETNFQPDKNKVDITSE